MATISFQSNQTVQGTGANDYLVGNDTAGNNNDIVYGHLGNDTITSDSALNNSTLYGGQGDDFLLGNNGSALYGNQGNDALEAFGTSSVISSSDALYGGQGDDYLVTQLCIGNVLYGNVGNDTVVMLNDFFQIVFAGQGQDSVDQLYSGGGTLYGNQGNDFVEDVDASGYSAAVNDSFTAEGSSTLFGGQGDDTLVAGGAGGDALFGGPGHNLYVGNALLSASSFTANDLLSVGGFVGGNDSLSLSTSIGAQTIDANSSGFLTKEEDTSAADAVAAMTDANSFYSGDTIPGYLFVYGGSGAGYLFYNGDDGGNAVNDGMILAGDNAEGSLQASDVVASKYALG